MGKKKNQDNSIELSNEDLKKFIMIIKPIALTEIKSPCLLDNNEKIKSVINVFEQMLDKLYEIELIDSIFCSDLKFIIKDYTENFSTDTVLPYYDNILQDYDDEY